MNVAMKPIYVRMADAKTMFGISRSTLYEMQARGEIVIHKRGKTSLLKVEEIERAIEAKVPR